MGFDRLLGFWRYSKNLPTSLQNKIAKDLGSFIKVSFILLCISSRNYDFFLKNMDQTRNVCAHNNRLLNYNCTANSVFQFYSHNFNPKDNDSGKTVYSTVVSLQCFISSEKFDQLWNNLKMKVGKQAEICKYKYYKFCFRFFLMIGNHNGFSQDDKIVKKKNRPRKWDGR